LAAAGVAIDPSTAVNTTMKTNETNNAKAITQKHSKEKEIVCVLQGPRLSLIIIVKGMLH